METGCSAGLAADIPRGSSAIIAPAPALSLIKSRRAIPSSRASSSRFSMVLPPRPNLSGREHANADPGVGVPQRIQTSGPSADLLAYSLHLVADFQKLKRAEYWFRSRVEVFSRGRHGIVLLGANRKYVVRLWIQRHGASAVDRLHGRHQA